MVYDLAQARRGVNLYPLDVRRLRRVALGNDELFVPRRLRRNEEGQYARSGAQRAVERELSEKHDAVQIRFQLLGRLQYAHGDGEIVCGTLFFYVCGGEIDGNFGERKLPAAVFESGAHPLAALLHGGVGKPYEFVRGQTVVDVRFRRNGNAVQPAEGKACDLR